MKVFSFGIAHVAAMCCILIPVRSQICGHLSLQASPFNSSELTSPNYPSNYPPSLTCQWTITAPTGYVIELTFITFTMGKRYSSDVYGGTSCQYTNDYLEIYDGKEGNKLLGKFCEDYLPPNVYDKTLLLKFKSGIIDSEYKKGFKIKYIAVVQKPDSTICSPFNTYSQNNAIKYSGSSGYIKSPLYGTKYPSNIQCTWIITVPEGKKVKLSFHDFEFVKIKYCSSAKDDYLEIRDGRYSFSSILKTLCSKSTTTHSSIDSTGRYMWIRFKSNTDNYITTNTAGFKIKYEAESTKINTVGIIVSVSVATVAIIVLVVVCVCIAKQKRIQNQVNTPNPTT